MSSDEQWATIADEILASVGLQECRWVAVRHDDHGIHIAATRSTAPAEFEKANSTNAARLEAKHCRRRTDRGTRTGGVALSSGRSGFVGLVRHLGAQLSTAHVDEGSGDVLRRVACEEADKVRHILGSTPPAQRQHVQ